MNEIAKLTAGEIVVADPFAPDTYHPAKDVDALIASARTEAERLSLAYKSLGNIDEAPIVAVKDCRKAIQEADDKLKDFDCGVKSALLALSGFDAYIVQTKGTGSRIDPLSVRGKLAEMIKALKAREDAEKPADPVHSYVIKLTCTDSVLSSTIKAAQKAGAIDVYATSPQTDKAAKTINAWFDENK